MIIAFSGAKFAGKDTAAEALIRSHGFKRIGLADKLKDICGQVFDIPREDMDNPSKKESQFKKELLLTEEHITTLLQRTHSDGFDFNYEKTHEQVCKNFLGKNLTSIRDVLQTVGTDICRTHIKDDIWLAYVHDTIKNFNGDVVITDARFRNERDFLQELGATLILVKRPGFEGKDTHISENQLGDENDYDVVVTNSASISGLQSDIRMWFSIMKDEIQNKNKSNRKR
jgi:hypothetical protein